MSDETAAGKAIPVSTLDEKGNAPKERIADAGRCYAISMKLIENDELRNRFDTRIRGMRDGNPPYSRALLKKHAQSNRTNINWMEGKAMISAAMVPYYDLMAGSLFMAQVKLKNPDASLKAEKSQIATEEFDYMLREWPAFNYNMDLAMTDRLTYGKGFVMWMDEYDPAFSWVNRFNVHVPDRTEACIDYVEVLVIEEEIPVDRLWKYANEGAERGWNTDQCKRSIRNAEPRITGEDPYRNDLVQQARNDKDILDGLSMPRVKAAHVLVKEFSGKVSHYIVDLRKEDRMAGGIPAGEKVQKGYLFRKVDRYDNWRQAFWASFHETLDGSWNGASALGKDILPQIEIKNRVKCAICDLGFTRSSVGLQATSEASFGKQQILQLGNVTVYPPGLNPIPVATHVGDIDSVIALDFNIEQTIGRNTGIYRQLPEKANGNPLTATGEMLRNQQSAVLTNSAVVRFYSDLDRLYYEIYRRTVHCPKSQRRDIVQEFVKRCEERGVTIEELREIDCVRAYRNIGNGSLVMRQQNLAQMASIVSLFPQSGQKNWVRDTVSSMTNVDTADRYIPADPAKEITWDHSLAMLENDSLVHGSPVQFSEDQNHVIHAQIHLQAAAQGLQSVEQGAEPESVLAALNGLMPHANAHILVLEATPGRDNEAKTLREQWNEISKLADELERAAQKIMQQRQQMAEAQRRAQAIADQSDPEIQIKAAETQAKLQMSQQRADAKIKMDEQRLAADIGMQARRLEAELAMSDASTGAGIVRANAETMSNIERQRREAAAKAATSTGSSGEGKTSESKASPATLNINLSADGATVKEKKPKRYSVSRDKKGKIETLVEE